MRILIVDDVAINRKLLSVTLQAEGFDTIEASDGAAALERLERDAVDAVISDVLMPRLDGFRFCHAVRSSDRFRHLPFIIYTGTYTSPGDERLSMKAGADAYLRKPCSTQTVIATLRDAIATRQQQAAARDETPATLEVTAEYSAAIIRKLEDKNADLERAQRDLRESEQRYRTVSEFTHDWEYWRGQDGRFLYVSPSCERLTGYAAADFLRDPDLYTNIVHEDDRPMMLDHVRDDLKHGQPCELEFRIVSRDGRERWIGHACRAVFDDGGRPLGRRGSNRDITERKIVEETLRQTLRALEAARISAERAKAAAEEASRAKDHFLAVLSHELRTPLTPALTALSLLEADASLPATARSYLEVIRRNVALESRLIDDLLDLTAIARGKVVLDKQPIDLLTLVEAAVDVCRPDIEARRLHFGVDTEGGPHLVLADGARLQQVLWNLLKNAIKFTPKGGCVGLRCRSDNGQIVVEVMDSGIGMDRSVLPIIFDAFAQAERSITRQFGGLGLGLAISKALVELHGGTIAADSRGLGQGASFRVCLPAMAKGAPSRPAALVPASRREVHQRLRVLLVEDHGDTSEMMMMMLQAEGHEVMTAGDVEQALKIAGESSFDVLVSDLGLPDRSGLELIRDLRARGNSIPAIALSGYGQESDIAQSRAAGFQLHLTKPVAADRVLDAIQKVRHGGPVPGAQR